MTGDAGSTPGAPGVRGEPGGPGGPATGPWEASTPRAPAPPPRSAPSPGAASAPPGARRGGPRLGSDARSAATGEGRLIAGRYLLLHALGRGGMGTVWLANDTLLGVDRALKEIRFGDDPTEADRHDRAERARREARAAARLAGHPGVVVVHDLVEEPDAPWIVMELLASSRSLDQVIRQDGTLSPSVAARVGLAVVEALDHGHRHDILHRDVKPANVLVTADGRVKLADFGIATYLDRAPLTQVTSISGTPVYMAPERLRKEKAGPASDLFSLGATLYAAVEGRAPFPTPTDAVRYAFNAQFPPPRPVHAGPLGPILDGLMTHDPRARLTAGSAARMLRDLAGDARTPGPAPEATTAFLPPISPGSGTGGPWAVSTPAEPGTSRPRSPGPPGTPVPGTPVAPRGAAAGGHRGAAAGGHPSVQGRAAPSGQGAANVPVGGGGPGRPPGAGAPYAETADAGFRWHPPAAPGWAAERAEAAFPSAASRRQTRRRGLTRRGLVAGGVALAAAGGGTAFAIRRQRHRGRPVAGTGGPATGGASSLSDGTIPEELRMQLSWTPDVEFAGCFFAESRGYYRDAGFKTARLLPGGPGALGAEEAVTSGRALLGFSAVDVLAREIIRGTPARAVGALYQRYPWVIASPGGTPLSSPAALVGKRIWVDKGAGQIWDTFLAANSISVDTITQVSDGSPDELLAAGKIDGLLSHVFDIALRLRLAGVEVATFLLADHGYPIVSSVYVASVEAVTHNRAAIRAALTAEIRGWRDNVRSPEAGARLTVTEYGTSLDERTQLAMNQIQNTLIVSDDTRRNGLLTVTPDLAERNVRALLSAGYRVSVDDLFDMSLLTEIYRDNPSLLR
ncbi:protein kinase domain-containing protein [Pseudofrankia sp. BMG5.37]|uniref:protein kinase domain-containing protein n=1 Tax=Pseudofrankia sp. BMG5.37 TaxID=3050035 RepID=UPI002895096B|nr:protein kinase [Pseudofrankia sp. BMG5.37]MDT3438897.1 ABC transporter substrate-binding protein [Pseudofrankia sp. BMG5.37]